LGSISCHAIITAYKDEARRAGCAPLALKLQTAWRDYPADWTHRSVTYIRCA
jgi:hypothetical protein